MMEEPYEDLDVKELAIAAANAYAKAEVLALILDQTVDELRSVIATRHSHGEGTQEQEQPRAGPSA